MNFSEQEIENTLRRAPQPPPPSGLKEQLIAQAKFPGVRKENSRVVTTPMRAGWLRRWWPALAPASVSLACAVVLLAQQTEISDLRENIRSLSEPITATETAPIVATRQSRDETLVATPSLTEQQEIARLKQLVVQLTGEITQLELVQKESQRLRTQIAREVSSGPSLTEMELEAATKAREKAMAIQCVNNMKQLGLAVRIWANDKNDLFPPEILSMTNEMNTPKILVCPAETNRQAAVTWALYTAANCSYEYLAPSGNSTEPMRVLFRCPVHGNIGLCDGSVQMAVGRNHPDWFIQRDGKLYYEPKTPAGDFLR